MHICTSGIERVRSQACLSQICLSQLASSLSRRSRSWTLCWSPLCQEVLSLPLQFLSSLTQGLSVPPKFSLCEGIDCWPHFTLGKVKSPSPSKFWFLGLSLPCLPNSSGLLIPSSLKSHGFASHVPKVSRSPSISRINWIRMINSGNFTVKSLFKLVKSQDHIWIHFTSTPRKIDLTF